MKDYTSDLWGDLLLFLLFNIRHRIVLILCV